jgi:SAM-dependent methyltransferase
MGVSEIYDRSFFAMHEPWRLEYNLIADALARLLAFESALDLGCGNGFIIARLRELGKAVRGIDGSREALSAAPLEIRDAIRVADLTTPLRVGVFDLVVCTEVAEHLTPRFADVLVANVCRASRGLAYFTAATPGQGGHCHVNEQPHDYWIAKFAQRGFQLDHAATDELRRALASALHTAWWFTNNSMIFRANSKDEG